MVDTLAWRQGRIQYYQTLSQDTDCPVLWGLGQNHRDNIYVRKGSEGEENDGMMPKKEEREFWGE